MVQTCSKQDMVQLCSNHGTTCYAVGRWYYPAGIAEQPKNVLHRWNAGRRLPTSSNPGGSPPPTTPGRRLCNSRAPCCLQRATAGLALPRLLGARPLLLLAAILLVAGTHLCHTAIEVVLVVPAHALCTIATVVVLVTAWALRVATTLAALVVAT